MRLGPELLDPFPAPLSRPRNRRKRLWWLSAGVQADRREILEESNYHKRHFVVRKLEDAYHQWGLFVKLDRLIYYLLAEANPRACVERQENEGICREVLDSLVEEAIRVELKC